MERFTIRHHGPWFVVVDNKRLITYMPMTMAECLELIQAILRNDRLQYGR